MFCTFAVIAIVLGVRWFGPHDLYEKDQPKTMAYTADIVRNGRFALPRDVIYQPATKPPMYNWVAAAVVKTTGVWTEWTLKFPSVVGVLATGAIVFAMAKRATKHAETSAVVVGLLATAIWFTFGSDVRHGSVLRLSYLARPDMFLCAALTGAWACFTVAIEGRPYRQTFRWALAGWLCVMTAALTKGPAALMPMAFAILYPLFQPNRREAYGRLWIWVGVPIVTLGVGGWFTLAYQQDPEHVRKVIWGAEVAGRIMDKSPEGFESKPYESVMWFVTKAQPWGAIATGGLLATLLVPRLRRTAGPAALYLTIVLIGLSLPAGKRMDYLLPAYAPAAVLIAVMISDLVRFRVVGAAAAVGLAAIVVDELILLAIRLADKGAKGHVDWTLLLVVGAFAAICLAYEQRRRLPLGAFAVVPLVLALMFGRAFLLRFQNIDLHFSDGAVAFVKDVRRQVPDSAKLLVIVRGKHPITTLLGRHPGSYLTPADLAAADYVIIPQQPDLPAKALSRTQPMGFDLVEKRLPTVLGLYEHVPLDRLIALQKAVGEWTVVENPYHEAGTVYRD